MRVVDFLLMPMTPWVPGSWLGPVPDMLSLLLSGPFSPVRQLLVGTNTWVTLNAPLPISCHVGHCRGSWWKDRKRQIRGSPLWSLLEMTASARREEWQCQWTCECGRWKTSWSPTPSKELKVTNDGWEKEPPYWLSNKDLSTLKPYTCR